MAIGQTSFDSMDRAIGQMIMTGFRGTSVDPEHPFFRQLCSLPPGFVVFFDEDAARGGAPYNIESPLQLRRLVARIQESSAEPILFALDQEGGQVARLKAKQGFPPSESARALGATNDPGRTYRVALEGARAMHEAGICLNLAPVVDLDLNPANPIIGRKERSFSPLPDVVVAHAVEFIRALHKNGVLCTLKHFPGQGSASRDTHLEFVDATAEWQEIELEPFRRLISLGVADAVMTAHVFDANLDIEWPATLSQTIIGGLLRSHLGFGGVVITDDLQMKSISDHYGLETILLRAIQAGADVLTFSNNVVDADPEIIARVVATVRQLVRQGVLAEDHIKASVDRIRDLKARAAELGKRRGTGATASASIPEAPPEASGHEELVRYREQLAMIQRRVEELLAPLDDRQLSWRPGPERWSVGECIEHLSIIGSLLAPKMEEAIQRGKKEGLYGRDPFTYSWPGRMFVESLQPSARVRIRTMRMYTPRRGVTKVQIVEKFQRTQKELLRLAGEAEGLDLARIKVASPANRLLRFSLGIWFAATVAHAQRHCEQAKRVLKEKEFPA